MKTIKNFNKDEWVFKFVNYYPGYYNVVTGEWIYKAVYDRLVRENECKNVD